ncbi:hypothetical protein GCM10009798_39120 [Nocardioides panacihumi]|uniref:Uncharacterized protein n=1 Tax=Nocardioides panacihumi TaxID=400774 RepID=A0ABP5D565_9ACTN
MTAGSPFSTHDHAPLSGVARRPGRRPRGRERTSNAGSPVAAAVRTSALVRQRIAVLITRG